MDCPKCGGAMWDNRNDKRNPKSPDFKCKNKSCGEGVWEPKSASSPAATNGKPASAKRPLGRLYYECMKIAHGSFTALKVTPSAGELAQATATIFIQASQSGAPLREEKAKPAAPPPPPPPQPEPEPEQSEAYEDDLPF